MGLAPHSSAGGSGSGHGPFGKKAFQAALIACAVLIAIGTAMLVLGQDAVRGTGIALIVVCGVALLTVGAGLLLERLTGRTPPPPPEVRGSNGRGRVAQGTRRRRR